MKKSDARAELYAHQPLYRKWARAPHCKNKGARLTPLAARSKEKGMYSQAGFFESSGNFSDPESRFTFAVFTFKIDVLIVFKIIQWSYQLTKQNWIVAHKLSNFPSSTDILIVSFSKVFIIYPWLKGRGAFSTDPLSISLKLPPRASPYPLYKCK